MSIDLQALPFWPLKRLAPLGIVLVVLVSALGYFLFIGDVLAKTEQKQQEEEALKKNYRDKRKQVLNLMALENQLKEIEVDFGELLRQLPTHIEVDGFINEITQVAGDHAVHVVSIHPEAERVSSGTKALLELPLRVRLSGRYHNIAGMLGDLGKLPRIISTENVKLTPISNKKKVLSAEAVIKTFRTKEIPKMVQDDTSGSR